MLHEDLADQACFGASPEGAVHEPGDAAVSSDREGIGLCGHAGQEGEHMDVPHGGEVVPELVVAEGVAVPLRECAGVGLLLVKEAQVAMYAVKDALGCVFSHPAEGLRCLDQHCRVISEVLVWYAVQSAAGRFHEGEAFVNHGMDSPAAGRKGVIVFQGPSYEREDEVEDESRLESIHHVRPRVIRPSADIVEGAITVEEAMEDTPPVSQEARCARRPHRTCRGSGGSGGIP